MSGTTVSGFDWPALMRAGIQGLRMQPHEFWRLTPAELALMIGADRVGPVMNRGRFDDLLRDFPDQTRGTENE